MTNKEMLEHLNEVRSAIMEEQSEAEGPMSMPWPIVDELDSIIETIEESPEK